MRRLNPPALTTAGSPGKAEKEASRKSVQWLAGRGSKLLGFPLLDFL
jgi:hypothetical protein